MDRTDSSGVSLAALALVLLAVLASGGVYT
jgi:hypothetical protein